MIVFYIKKSNPSMTQYYFKKILTYYLTEQMEFNTTKCVVVRCSRSPTPFQYDYRLNDHVLDIKDEHPYLGITLHKSLSWTSHISKIFTKASRTFNFLRRNLSKCSASIKTSAYLTLVCPIMEYAAVAWDPHQCNNIQTLEKSNVELPVG